MRISDWSSDVCSSDLAPLDRVQHRPGEAAVDPGAQPRHMHLDPVGAGVEVDPPYGLEQGLARDRATGHAREIGEQVEFAQRQAEQSSRALDAPVDQVNSQFAGPELPRRQPAAADEARDRSEEHASELQYLM